MASIHRRRDMRRSRCPIPLSWACAATLAALQPAYAFQIDTGIAGVRATWDNTFKYSNALRVKTPSQAIVGGEN
jgi:hypothetical protein